MIKKIKILAIVYWIILGVLGIYSISYCGFGCDLIFGKIPSISDIVTILFWISILIVGSLFINKFFKKDWFKKWWSIFIYFIIILYPLVLLYIGMHMLCGCADF